MVSNYFTWVAVVAMVVIYLQPVHCENFDPSNPRGKSGLAEAKEEVKKAAARQKAIDNGTYFSSPAGKNEIAFKSERSRYETAEEVETKKRLARDKERNLLQIILDQVQLKEGKVVLDSPADKYAYKMYADEDLSAYRVEERKKERAERLRLGITDSPYLRVIRKPTKPRH